MDCSIQSIAQELEIKSQSTIQELNKMNAYKCGEFSTRFEDINA